MELVPPLLILLLKINISYDENNTSLEEISSAIQKAGYKALDNESPKIESICG